VARERGIEEPEIETMVGAFEHERTTGAREMAIKPP
jgi:hypothetical protein